MTAYLWPIAATIIGAALVWGIRDVALRMIAANNVSAQHAKDIADLSDRLFARIRELEQRYEQKATEREAVHRKALNEVIAQCQREIDDMSGEVGGVLDALKTRIGVKAAESLETWRQNMLDARKERRKAAARS